MPVLINTFLWYLVKLDHVTKNGITLFPDALVFFYRVDFSLLFTFSIWLQVFSLYLFSQNSFSKSLVFFLHSSKVKQTRFILNTWLKEIHFLVKDDVLILHGGLGSQLVPYKVLLTEGYVLYKLKCLKL